MQRKLIFRAVLSCILGITRLLAAVNPSRRLIRKLLGDDAPAGVDDDIEQDNSNIKAFFEALLAKSVAERAIELADQNHIGIVTKEILNHPDEEYHDDLKRISAGVEKSVTFGRSEELAGRFQYNAFRALHEIETEKQRCSSIQLLTVLTLLVVAVIFAMIAILRFKRAYFDAEDSDE